LLDTSELNVTFALDPIGVVSVDLAR
jgi:hypothetical protein